MDKIHLQVVQHYSYIYGICHINLICGSYSNGTLFCVKVPDFPIADHGKGSVGGEEHESGRWNEIR